MPTIAIRMLGPDDAAVLANVADEVFDNAVDADSTAAFLADARHHLAVALDRAQVVGMASAVRYVQYPASSKLTERSDMERSRMSAQSHAFVSIEEYLAVERDSATRYEYVAGTIFAMAGGSEQHNLLMGNVYASLHSQLRRRQCTIYPSDMKVVILSVPRYTYPDISVVCGDA